VGVVAVFGCVEVPAVPVGGVVAEAPEAVAPGSGWKKTTRSNVGALAPQPVLVPVDPLDAA
jgi:hypothetical protein